MTTAWTRNLVVALSCLSLAHGAWAREAPSPADRAAFKGAVDAYQVFVVAHCAPDVVRTYVAARADRDRAFLRSLQNTGLDVDYVAAVAERAVGDRHTVYECSGPPPPPPPPPSPPGQPPVAPAPPDPQQEERARQADLAAHFEAGDRQFGEMVRLRDRMLGSAGK